jgi:hypothetical protein
MFGMINKLSVSDILYIFKEAHINIINGLDTIYTPIYREYQTLMSNVSKEYHDCIHCRIFSDLELEQDSSSYENQEDMACESIKCISSRCETDAMAPYSFEKLTMLLKEQIGA